MRIRRNMDEGARAFEREAHGGSREAARRLGLAMLRSGELPRGLGRLNAARAAAGLSEIRPDVGPNCLLTMLGDPPSALVRVTWDDLAWGLDVEDSMIYFNGSDIVVPDWIDEQAHGDAHQWIKEHKLRLTDDQQHVVYSQFLDKIHDEWVPRVRLNNTRLLEDWIVRPINKQAEDVTRNSEWYDERLEARVLDFCGGEAIRIEEIDTRDDAPATETGVTFRVFWPIWTAWYNLGSDESVWRDPVELKLEGIAYDALLGLARDARYHEGIRVRLPDKSSCDYDHPDDSLLFAEIAKHAPKKPKPKRHRRENAGRADLTLTVAPDPDYPQFTSFVWSPVVHESWQMFGYGVGGTPLGPLSPEAIRSKVERMVRIARDNGYSVLVDDRTGAWDVAPPG